MKSEVPWEGMGMNVGAIVVVVAYNRAVNVIP